MKARRTRVFADKTQYVYTESRFTDLEKTIYPRNMPIPRHITMEDARKVHAAFWALVAEEMSTAQWFAIR